MNTEFHASDALSLPSGGRSVQSARGQSSLWLAIAAIALAGLVIRVFAASGDLWLDEIWSLDLVGRLTSIDQVFWRINHDNNHFLNSAWLYLTGPDSPPLVQRLLSIALGTATVFAAAAVVADCGRPTQLAAALLFAISYPIVHYGSEARGYSGLVLFTLLSVFCLERRLDNRGSGIALAAAILFGFLSHLTMLGTVAVLVAWTASVSLRRGGGVVRAGVDTIKIFAPSFLAVLPLALCIVVGAKMFGFTVGGSSAFSFETFASGYGGMIRHLFGLPVLAPDWALILAAGGLVCVSAWVWPSRRASLYVIGIVGLPLLMMLARLPNLEFPRYYIASGALLLLWAAELFGHGFAAAGWRRWIATLALAAMVAGCSLALSRFFEAGRGSYASVVERMTGDGPASYAASNDFRTGMVVDFFAKRQGVETRLVTAAEMCTERPDWLIVEIRSTPSKPLETAPDCDLVYERVEVAEAWGLSGITWALCRKREAISSVQVLSVLEAFRLTPVMR